MTATAERAAVRAAGRPVVEVLGVRHHGPGSARAVLAVLEELKPEVVLIEGPPEADALVGLAASPHMRPPVALLAYAPDRPELAAFWPFAVFSPEWQALRWAVVHDVPVRFCDLPAGAVLAARAETSQDTAEPGPRPAPCPGPDAPAGPPADESEVPARPSPRADAPPSPAAAAGEPADAVQTRRDPLALLAAAAGYDDAERWWDTVVESRLDGAGPFAALTEAMTELRSAAPRLDPAERAHEERREARMRTVLRDAIRSGADRIAVVCGAWHAPALTGPLPPASADARLLAGLPKRRTACTWVPWTYARLASASGYGAGITSPGWYHHLFTARDRPVVRWLTEVARVLRAEDLPVSSAHVIEAVRLAETLAVLRDRPLAGLSELTEATRAVLCEGDDVALALVTERLVVGDRLGEVPPETPTVPLEEDLRAVARRLRLAREPFARDLDLDLRTTGGRDRSVLLHRLRLLGIGWGTPRGSGRGTGTFRESWSVCWQPEFAVDLVEAAVWGTTVAAAASAKLLDTARGDADLPALVAAVSAALAADLPAALPGLLAALDARAAVAADLAHLMDALPPLVATLRYGDARGTDATRLADVADALAVRIRAGLPVAAGGLDAGAATELRRRIDAVHGALSLRGDEVATGRWLDVLAGLAERPDVHGLLAGRIVRLLRDVGRVDAAGTAARLGRALSAGAPVTAKAEWVEGFLGGGGLLLLHDPDLLRLLDTWTSGLGDREFTAALPLLRRTFGSFETGERRNLGDRVRRLDHGPAAEPGGAGDGTTDIDQAAAALRTVAVLMGVDA